MHSHSWATAAAPHGHGGRESCSHMHSWGCESPHLMGLSVLAVHMGQLGLRAPLGAGILSPACMCGAARTLPPIPHSLPLYLSCSSSHSGSGCGKDRAAAAAHGAEAVAKVYC